LSGQETDAGYSGTARAFHWITVIGLLWLFVSGFWIQALDTADPLKGTLRGLHRSTGLTLAVLTVFRVLYRIRNQPPPLPASTPHWQAEIARTIQWVFYAMLIFMPAIGWGYANTLGQTVHVWWLISLPAIADTATTDRNTLLLLDWAHEYGAYLFMGLAGPHVLGALYHGLVKRDGVLSAIVFGGRS
jgi:cytochrome b561